MKPKWRAAEAANQLEGPIKHLAAKPLESGMRSAGGEVTAADTAEALEVLANDSVSKRP